MKIFLILFLFNFTFFINELKSTELSINLLKEGGKIIFIRHALAPGNGDPENFDLNDCKSQRNLSKIGIEQSKKIGLFFENNNIEIDKILTSEWCRCKDTAKYAFHKFQTLDLLNSFYNKKFIKNKDNQISNLKVFIKDWQSEKNLILITHFVVISEILNTSSTSGEIIIADKNYNILKKIIINN